MNPEAEPTAPDGTEVLVECGRCHAAIDALCDTHEPPGLGAAGQCPRCESQDANDFAPMEADDEDRRVLETVTCAACGHKWRNRFVLVSQGEA